MNLYFDYWVNIFKIFYGVGGNSIGRVFDYEVFVGVCIGFDWSFSWLESEVGFFNYFNNEIECIVFENEFIVV